MSRSVTSRRSLGSLTYNARASKRRFPDNVTFSPRITAKQATVGVFQRSVPSSTQSSVADPDQKTIRILDNLEKKLQKVITTQEDQLNIFIKLQGLHEKIDHPKRFWNNWIEIKKQIIELLQKQQQTEKDYNEFAKNITLSFQQFRDSLDEINKKLPKSNETSSKSLEIHSKFSQLKHSFNEITNQFDTLNDSMPDDQLKSELRSLLSSLSIYCQIIPTQYQEVFDSLRDPDVKKGTDVHKFTPLLSPRQQKRIVTNLTSQIENVEIVISTFIDKNYAETAITNLLQTTELNLRKWVTAFPSNLKDEYAKQKNPKFQKQTALQKLQQQIQELTTETETLTKTLSDLQLTEKELRGKMAEDTKFYYMLQKRYLEVLKGEIDETVIDRSYELIEKYQRQNHDLAAQTPLVEKNLNELKVEYHTKLEQLNQLKDDLSAAEDSLLATRANNFIQIDLLNEFTDIGNNIQYFMKKWKAQLKYQVQKEFDTELNFLMQQRSAIQYIPEHSTPKKQISDQLNENERLFESNRSTFENLEKLTWKTFRRRLKHFTNIEVKNQYDFLKKSNISISQASRSKSRQPKDQFDELKSQAEYLSTQFQLDFLTNQTDDNTNSSQHPNPEIINNANQIRDYLLNVQANNYSIKMALKAAKEFDNDDALSIQMLEKEALNNLKSAKAYNKQKEMGLKMTEYLENTLNLPSNPDAILETRYAAIIQEVKSIQNQVDGDLDKEINRLKRKIAEYQQLLEEA